MISIASAGLGHGNYLAVKILFPYAFYIAYRQGEIAAASLLVAIMQYPLYGAVIGVRKTRKVIAVFLLMIHVVFAAISVGVNF